MKLVRGQCYVATWYPTRCGSIVTAAIILLLLWPGWTTGAYTWNLVRGVSLGSDFSMVRVFGPSRGARVMLCRDICIGNDAKIGSHTHSGCATWGFSYVGIDGKAQGECRFPSPPWKLRAGVSCNDDRRMNMDGPDTMIARTAASCQSACLESPDGCSEYSTERLRHAVNDANHTHEALQLRCYLNTRDRHLYPCLTRHMRSSLHYIPLGWFDRALQSSAVIGRTGTTLEHHIPLSALAGGSHAYAILTSTAEARHEKTHGVFHLTRPIVAALHGLAPPSGNGARISIILIVFGLTLIICMGIACLCITRRYPCLRIPSTYMDAHLPRFRDLHFNANTQPRISTKQFNV
jgi:hypothetical protein